MAEFKCVNHEYTVDIVIPVRDREEYDVIERLKFRKYYNFPKNFNIFLVDYGSTNSVSEQLKKICLSEGYQYCYANTRMEMFSLSHARNIAILNSKSDYLIYEDIDLVSHKNFYIWINHQIQSMIIERSYPFLVIPVAYISEKNSDELYHGIGDYQYNAMVSELYNIESDVINFFAVASSYIICSRKMSKFIGGFDERFKGWGFEDSDFELRLLKYTNIDKPRDFYKYDTRPYLEQIQWSGWKVLLRVFADVLMFKGIYSFHIWHPKPEHRSKDIISYNRQLFKENSKKYAESKNTLKPLHNYKESTDLFFNDDPLYFNVSLFHYFDNPLVIYEQDIELDNLDDLIKRYNIRRAVFSELYENGVRVKLYSELKKRGVQTYFIGKGALPNSVYIDSTGYINGNNYILNEKWIKSVNEEKIDKAYKFIENYKLEVIQNRSNNHEAAPSVLYEMLVKQFNKKKVLLLLLNPPKDLNIKYNHRDFVSYNKFLDEMKNLAHKLEGSDWLLIYKSLSQTNNKIGLENAICVNNYDLDIVMNASDRICMFQGDAGVQAMIYSKPLYYFGDIFYSLSGVNMKVQDSNSLYMDLITNDFLYNEKSAVCFLSYLINDFYSFVTNKQSQEEKSVLYDVVRVDMLEIYSNINPLPNLKSSILFDRYRTDDYFVRNKTLLKSKSNSKIQVDSELIVRKMQSMDRLKKNKFSKNKYSIKSKIKKFLKDPNQFFADYFIKKLNK